MRIEYDCSPDEPPDLTGVPPGGAQVTLAVAKDAGIARLRLATRDEETGTIEEVWAIWTPDQLRDLAKKLVQAADQIDGGNTRVTQIS